MIRALFAREIRASLTVVGIFAAVIAVYVAMVMSMFDPKLVGTLDEMAASMPQIFAAFGMSTHATTLIGFMLNYLYGFLLTVLPLALIMLLVNRLIIRHLDRGSMAYLLATPMSRKTIVLSMAGVLAATLIGLLCAITGVELACAATMLPGKLAVAPLVRANAGLFALWIFFSGVCFLSACALPGAGAARWCGGSLCILFLLMQMISQVGDRFEFLKNVNPLTLFDCYGLAAADGASIAHAALLGAGGIALLGVAIVVFDRRDLDV
ncbi:hypothetical protein Corgl_1665 [Coriobacterium glomerans PW2]|uniref:ABC transporter permease n=1 Tax=Coriobacterium glomerans (strain ATCC 49209 / DSM 20642 / JCM 10262 / PW2) TaxID=700015 RepID=F2NB13_CORGP|nr:membrane protein [Coriobacterium glomerans]AEB07764.1 hypothetical protein Corgl_1665 [Coriobacterium glomerans PW2]